MEPSIEDCLKLLKGERDEQRLAGLLLAIKFCKTDDSDLTLMVYNAVGDKFLDRFLRTGMAKGSTSDDGEYNHNVYLHLSVTILAAFVRVSSIASSDDMVNKIPLILEILSKELGPSLVDECLEFLYLVSTSHNYGVQILYIFDGITVIGSQMSNLPEGSRTRELATKLYVLALSQLSMEELKKMYLLKLSSMARMIGTNLGDQMDLYEKIINSTKVDDGDENIVGSRIVQLLIELHRVISEMQARISSGGLEIFSSSLTSHQQNHHRLSQAFDWLRSRHRAKKEFDTIILALLASVCLLFIFWLTM